MSATLTLAPPSIHFSDDPTPVTLLTDSTIAALGNIRILISGAGPTAGQTLNIGFQGYNLEFVATATDTPGALDWPTKSGAETLEAYATRLVEFLYQNETINTYFTITRAADSGGAKVIVLTQKVLETVLFRQNNDFSNVALELNDVAAPAPAALRGLVQVWRSGASPVLLASLHSPYDLVSKRASLDLSGTLGALVGPQAPPESSMQDGVGTAAPPFGEATLHLLKYHLRYADKYGTPAVAEALIKGEADHIAVLGGTAAGSEFDVFQNARHVLEVDGEQVPKRMSTVQPDWLYISTFGWDPETTVRVNVLVEVNGELALNMSPFGGNNVDLAPDKIYWFPAGYRQLRLHTVEPAPGDGDLTGYTLRIISPDGATVYAARKYRVPGKGEPSRKYFLLYENGVGGLETAWLSAWPTESLSIEQQVAEQPQGADKYLQPQFQAYGIEGRRTWELGTGFFPEEHKQEMLALQQLGLAKGKWLIDLEAQRFMPVILESRELRTREGESTEYGFKLTFRSAWVDKQFNW